MELLLILVVVGGVVFFISKLGQNKKTKEVGASQFQDAQADARRWIERLGNQVLTLSGTDAASTQALADASERYNAASAAIGQATTVRQAQLARESALEGLYYVNAAREIMDLPAGPEIPPLEGQRKAGKVSERRTIEHDGQTITASPEASAETPNYYPGGNVAGRPVPAGWYSTPWWAPALASGMWTAGSVLMFSSLFGGMMGVPSAAAFESGYQEGLADGQAEGDGGDGGEDMGADDGGDMGGDDFGGDAGGGDDGGFFGFGGDDGGGFDFDFDF